VDAPRLRCPAFAGRVVRRGAAHTAADATANAAVGEPAIGWTWRLCSDGYSVPASATAALDKGSASRTRFRRIPWRRQPQTIAAPVGGPARNAMRCTVMPSQGKRGACKSSPWFTQVAGWRSLRTLLLRQAGRRLKRRQADRRIGPKIPATWRWREAEGQQGSASEPLGEEPGTRREQERVPRQQLDSRQAVQVVGLSGWWLARSPSRDRPSAIMLCLVMRHTVALCRRDGTWQRAKPA